MRLKDTPLGVERANLLVVKPVLGEDVTLQGFQTGVQRGTRYPFIPDGGIGGAMRKTSSGRKHVANLFDNHDRAAIAEPGNNPNVIAVMDATHRTAKLYDGSTHIADVDFTPSVDPNPMHRILREPPIA